MSAPVIGLVGGIGSGKSAVAEVWRDAGCCVCESDLLAKQALQDPAVRAEIRAWWGPTVVASDGLLDRARIAAIVFANPAERTRLESLVHPWIERARRAMFAAAPLHVPAFIIDAPLLLEVGLDRECDAVVFVDAPFEARLARVVARRGWTAEELARREASQWPIERKRAAASDIIVNDRDLAALRIEASSVFAKILQRHSARAR